jgi:hypothetical protein
MAIAKCYLKLLQDTLLQLFKAMGVYTEKIFSQQDGTRLMVNAAFHFLSKHFHDSIISEEFEIMSCPQCSSDTNPCDYFLWAFLKYSVHRNNRHIDEELKERVTVAMDTITQPATNFEVEERLKINLKKYLQINLYFLVV